MKIYLLPQIILNQMTKNHKFGSCLITNQRVQTHFKYLITIHNELLLLNSMTQFRTSKFLELLL